MYLHKPGGEKATTPTPSRRANIISLVVHIVVRFLIDRSLVDAVVHLADFVRPAPASLRAVAHNRLVNRVRTGRVPAVPRKCIKITTDG